MQAKATLEKTHGRAVRRWRHLERGSTYLEITRGQLQCSAAEMDYAHVVVYLSEQTGTVWCRPVSEFEDGRFEELSSLEVSEVLLLAEEARRGLHVIAKERGESGEEVGPWAVIAAKTPSLIEEFNSRAEADEAVERIFRNMLLPAAGLIDRQTQKVVVERTAAAFETTIPYRHQDFCKAVARVCKEYGIDKFGGQFTPGWNDDWHHPISFSWEQGRHGEDAGKINMQSQVCVHAKIEE